MQYDTFIHLSPRIYLSASMKHNFYLFQRRRARVGVHGNHRYARQLKLDNSQANTQGTHLSIYSYDYTYLSVYLSIYLFLPIYLSIY